jgi:hypothetical protein
MNKLSEHLAQPWKTRRYLLILSNLVALGLAVFCTVTQVELKGQELITILMGRRTSHMINGTEINGTRKWLLGIVAGLVITVGGYGFIRAVTSVDASAVKEQDDRIDSLETTNEKLDTIIEDLGEVKQDVRHLVKEQHKEDK